MLRVSSEIKPRDHEFDEYPSPYIRKSDITKYFSRGGIGTWELHICGDTHEDDAADISDYLEPLQKQIDLARRDAQEKIWKIVQEERKVHERLSSKGGMNDE